MADINLGVGGANSATGGYEIENSLKLEEGATEYLTRTPSSAGNEKTWTWSGWIKYTEPSLSPQTIFAGGTDSGSYGALNFRIDAGQMELNTASVAMRTATQKFRDTSAWYHFVVAMDTTQSTADDRIKIYVNGSQITDFNVFNNPPQNTDMGVNANELQTISRRSNANDRYFSGYIAEVHLIDGTALTPTSFGEYDTNGIWKPKAYDGSYGTNGYYLKFDDSSSLGADSSGNGNNFTLNNISAADQATDTPTNNFCTLNQLWKYGNVPSVENCTYGGTIIQHNGPWSGAKATMGVDKGKWYWECKIGQRENTMWGIQTDGEDNIGSGNAHDNKSTHVLYSGFSSGGYLITTQNGTIAGDTSNYSAVWSPGDIAGIALDMDNNQITYYRNGSGLGSAFTAITIHDNADKVNFPFIATYREYIKINFGGYSDWESGGNSDANGYGSFQYSVPSGYYALCTKNLAEYG